MGNEIFYCTECGVRTSGSDFAPGTSGFGAERSCCPACLGLPIVPRRESTKKIRKPSSATLTATLVRPRTAEAPPPRRSFVPFIAAAILAGAGAFAFLASAPAPESRPSVVVPSMPPPPQATAPLPVLPDLPSVANDQAAKEGPPRPPAAGELPPVLEAKRETPLRPAVPEPPSPELEALADAAYDEIEEAASALADEGRVADALAQIRRFPPEYKATRAGTHLEGLRRRIEQRAR